MLIPHSTEIFTKGTCAFGRLVRQPRTITSMTSVALGIPAWTSPSWITVSHVPKARPGKATGSLWRMTWRGI